MITRLDGASARKISAGQVITDLTSVVKELLENALDAQAKTVKVRLVNYGLDEIVVEDDGTGIAMGPLVDTQTGQLQADATTPLLACRASTKQHEDEAQDNDRAADFASAKASSSARSSSSSLSLAKRSSALLDDGDADVDETDPSLGFRGEALHSLAHVSDLTVETRTTEFSPYTIRIAYDHTSHSSHLEALRLRDTCGTTVTARHLFQSLPVRHREYTKSFRKQLSKATSTMKQYAVSHPNIRLLMTHQETLASAVTTLVSLTGSGDPTRSVTEAYGGLCISKMQRVQWTFSFGHVTGFVSKVDGGGRLSSDHQVFALDGRLVDLPRLGKAVSDAFAQCLPNASQRLHGSFFLHIRSNASLQYDVNLTPNKRKVLLAQEEKLAGEVYRCALQEFSLASQSIELNRDQRMAQTQAADLRATERTKLTRTPVSATAFTQFTFKRPKVDAGGEERGITGGGGTVKSETQMTAAPTASPSTVMDLPKLGTFLYADSPNNDDTNEGTTTSPPELLPLSSPSSSSSTAAVAENGDDEGASCGVEQERTTTAARNSKEASHGDDDAQPNEEDASVGDGGAAALSAVSKAEVTRLSDEGSRPRSGGTCHHCTYPSLSEIASVDLARLIAFPSPGSDASFLSTSPSHKRSRVSTIAAHSRTLGAQTDADLDQYFNKNSFKEMRVLGQFNHGFIIAVLKNGDVFIVDQHASDEKYNYERLVRLYEATPQPLVMPVPVAMDTHEVDLAIEHAAALQQHGFKVRRGADDTKLLVCSLPVLPYDVVNASDVMELVQQLAQYGTITKPLRAVWHSMATKACRSSIMIGTALAMKKMKQILERLGELEQPWNCPHGRPTLRLLGNLADLRKPGGGGTP